MSRESSAHDESRFGRERGAPQRNSVIGSSYTDFPSFGALKGFSKKILPDGSNPFLQNSHGED
jgi:hypothetical protein